MDIFTQGSIGAALALASRRKKQAATAAGFGFLGGLAPDLDILIRSSEDTLLFLEYHRHFTHSLIFIPLGSITVAGLIYCFGRRWISLGFWKIWIFCAMGYGTHGLLDAMTSFGTSLLWPLSDTRFSLSIISIIDPLFTLPIVALVGAGIFKKDGLFGRIALVWAIIYLSAAGYLNQQARSMAKELANDRGHKQLRLLVKPTFANIILWRSVYEFDGRYYIDALRPWPNRKFFDGTSIASLIPTRDFPWLRPGSRQARDVERFSELSDGYVAKAADGSPRVIDVRYSIIPTDVTPLWFIRLIPDSRHGRRAIYGTERSNARKNLSALMHMIFEEP